MNFALKSSGEVKSVICAREFWRDAEVLESARVDAPSTVRETLEARLELREWLEGKATPEEIARLL